ncbi:MAG: isopentenyl phosphate kinase [archaeon]|nr:isopentenyl phosphate kinase [archaeon]
MILIKLGGSVITDKSRYRTFNRECTARLCQEIKKSGKSVIIIHGAGSFGHIIASRHFLNLGLRSKEQISAYVQACYDTRCLSLLVVKELNDAGLPAVSIPTGSCFMTRNGRLVIRDDSVLREMFKLGVIPVTFGDVVLDTKFGLAICSGDQLVETFVDIFHPSKVVFVSDVDGLYYDDPKCNPGAGFVRIVSKSILSAVKTDNVTTDVTGGMKKKVETMLRISSKGCDCVLVNGIVKGRLLSVLADECVPCTIAKGQMK